MKHLLIILLLALTLTGDSQNDWRNEWLKEDKAAHILASTSLTMVSTVMLQEWGVNRNDADIIGIGISLSVGVCKEFLHDSRPSPHDLAANMVGAVGGIYLNRLLQSIPPPEVRKQRRIERKLKRFTLGTI
jgi:uncharacterized protein YfiM (DUF2279 family)